jgi:hypothetical protein
MIALRWNNLSSSGCIVNLASLSASLAKAIFPGSSAVEHPTVNRTAACSNQARGATLRSICEGLLGLGRDNFKEVVCSHRFSDVPSLRRIAAIFGKLG